MSQKSKIRAAEAKMANAYYNALNDTKRLDPVRSADTRVRAKLEDAMGDNLDAGTKRLARQADSLASELNAAQKAPGKDYSQTQIKRNEGSLGTPSSETRKTIHKTAPSFSDRVSAFNNRYDLLRRQLAGERVADDPAASRTKADLSEASQARAAEKAGAGKGALGNGLINFGTSPHPLIEPRTTPANNGVKSGSAPVSSVLDSISANAQFEPLANNRDSIPYMMRAYNSLKALGDSVSADPATALNNRYSALAKQINANVKRSANNNIPSPGLINSDLASGAPVQEVIR